MAPDNATGRRHRVRQGDCISSIAIRYGHFWLTIWDDANNQEVRELRDDPDQLMPGDEIWVPNLRRRDETGATEQRHRFQRRGVPARLRLRFLLKGEPRHDDPYVIIIDGGEILRGNLDSDGMLDVPIPPDAQQARVNIGEGADEKQYMFWLGHIDPVNEVSGIQRRLENLNYTCPATGALDDGTRAAILAFQVANGLEETGEPDDATRDAIRNTHGS